MHRNVHKCIHALRPFALSRRLQLVYVLPPKIFVQDQMDRASPPALDTNSYRAGEKESNYKINISFLPHTFPHNYGFAWLESHLAADTYLT